MMLKSTWIMGAVLLWGFMVGPYLACDGPVGTFGPACTRPGLLFGPVAAGLWFWLVAKHDEDRKKR